MYSVTVNKTWNASTSEFLTMVANYRNHTTKIPLLSLEVFMHLHLQKLPSCCGKGSMATNCDTVCSTYDWFSVTIVFFSSNTMLKQGH